MMKYDLTEEQRNCILDLLIKREVELCKKMNFYQEVRRSERGISGRQAINEETIRKEMGLIHTIFEELEAI